MTNCTIVDWREHLELLTVKLTGQMRIKIPTE